MGPSSPFLCKDGFGTIEKIDASITQEGILKLADPSWQKKRGARLLADDLASDINRAMAPKALYHWFRIASVKKEAIALAHPATGETARLSTGDFSPFFKKANHLLIALYTLGNGLDALINKFSHPHQEMERHFIYMGALSALSKASSPLATIAETRAKKEGVGVSPPLSPGSIDGWDLSGQREIAALFPLLQLGVSLNHLGLFTPMNTLSVVFAIGKGFSDRRAGSPCRLCRMGGLCSLTCSNHHLRSEPTGRLTGQRFRLFPHAK